MRPATLLAFFSISLALSAMPARAQTALPDVSPALLEDIVVGSRILADFGVVDGFGHVSARHPTNPKHFLMSRSLAPALVTADDIMEFDEDGNAVDTGGHQVFLERFIHAEIYKARPDVMSVVHTHAPSVIPFSVSKTPLRPLFHNAGFLAAGVPVWDIAKEFGTTDMLVRDNGIGKSLARTLADKSVVLMRGHGAATVGDPTSRSRCSAPTTPTSMRACSPRRSGSAARSPISARKKARKPTPSISRSSTASGICGSCGCRRSLQVI